jgi:hypothetical protein
MNVGELRKHEFENKPLDGTPSRNYRTDIFNVLTLVSSRMSLEEEIIAVSGDRY